MPRSDSIAPYSRRRNCSVSPPLGRGRVKGGGRPPLAFSFLQLRCGAARYPLPSLPPAGGRDTSKSEQLAVGRLDAAVDCHPLVFDGHVLQAVLVLITSTPAPACALTTPPVAFRAASARAASSTASPRDTAPSISTSPSGRGRLPAWVVRIRPSLRFMVITTESAETTEGNRIP